MTKEEVLAEMKAVVLDMKKMSVRQKNLVEEAGKLNSCDASWVNDEYGAWFKSEIQPHLPEDMDTTIKQ